MGIEEEENPKPRTRRELEEDHTPLWIKLFGGSILSIAFLCVITLTGYIVANITSIQNQVNCVNADMITRKEFSDRLKTILDSIKIDNDNIVSLKERQYWMEETYKKQTNVSESQLTQLREENRQLQKDIQLLRERVAAIEGKSSGPIPDKKKE